MPAPNPEKDKEAVRLVQTHGSVTEAAKASGIPYSTLSARYARGLTGKDVKVHTAPPKATDTGEKLEIDENKNARHYHCISKDIRTLEDLIEYAEIDTNIWKAVRVVANKWEMAAKFKGITGEKLVKQQLWQIKAWFERVIPEFAVLAADSLYDRIRSFKTPVVKRAKRTTQHSHMLEIALFDHHFGKLGWAPETGSNYDLNIAETIYMNAVEDLLDRVGGYNIEKILFPIGQDFFHINNWNETTAKGTPMDVDGRFPKVFDAGCMAVVNAINRCLEVAPVEVLWVPGNHDPETSWYMLCVLDAWYNQHPDVTFDRGPRFRKYKQYGVNLIGFTHGNEEKHRDLPGLMACEVPDLWSSAKTRTWHLGHFHKSKQLHFMAGDSYNGVVVAILPSLCGTDAWHYKKGYITSQRAAEAHLWSFDEGYVGHFNANVREN